MNVFYSVGIRVQRYVYYSSKKTGYPVFFNVSPPLISKPLRF
jgi:hypothetical protein